MQNPPRAADTTLTVYCLKQTFALGEQFLVHHSSKQDGYHIRLYFLLCFRINLRFVVFSGVLVWCLMIPAQWSYAVLARWHVPFQYYCFVFRPSSFLPVYGTFKRNFWTFQHRSIMEKCLLLSSFNLIILLYILMALISRFTEYL